MTVLNRVSDSDSFKIILDTIKSNADIVVSSINQLSEEYTAIFYEIIKDVELVEEPPEDYLNRNTYIWMINTFKVLQKVLNKEIGIYNANGLVSAPNYLDTQVIALWTPLVLETKNYVTNINVDFNQLETTLNILETSLEPYK